MKGIIVEIISGSYLTCSDCQIQSITQTPKIAEPVQSVNIGYIVSRAVLHMCEVFFKCAHAAILSSRDTGLSLYPFSN